MKKLEVLHTFGGDGFCCCLGDLLCCWWCGLPGEALCCKRWEWLIWCDTDHSTPQHSNETTVLQHSSAVLVDWLACSPIPQAEYTITAIMLVSMRPLPVPAVPVTLSVGHAVLSMLASPSTQLLSPSFFAPAAMPTAQDISHLQSSIFVVLPHFSLSCSHLQPGSETQLQLSKLSVLIEQLHQQEASYLNILLNIMVCLKSLWTSPHA